MSKSLKKQVWTQVNNKVWNQVAGKVLIRVLNQVRMKVWDQVFLFYKIYDEIVKDHE
jgi:hypothetical protein